MQTEFQGITIESVKGDITKQDGLEAVVNAANAQLLIGGGVAGAIHRAAGPELEEACKSLAPISPGEAVITEGFQMPNDYIIHCLGPVYGVDKPSDELLRAAYLNALQLAEDKGITSIGFPALSTGAFGYPLDQALEDFMPAFLEQLSRAASVRHIRFVLFSGKDAASYEKYIQEAVSS
ncbi:macro domain-containing protein [Marinococcus luteus]|uniref:macro domain-containing protein n=1 Tax=Marinococcus luteus TaxID=1122204 RepID=UPI002ACD0185|nr:macro domain-containing protein [Marinococcus luteus]MDZ5782567.1 macro domain-containing protein [Marinococcus luteus]